jgi:predicted amidophosphoribosyltransferase
MDSLRDAAGDLLLGGRCAGCRAPGRRLCARCGVACAPAPRPAWPTPTPAGLLEPPVLPVAAAAYAGVVRELVVGFKEHERFGLVRVLAPMLVASVEHCLAQLPPGVAPVTLVPMPSAPAAVRARGHDAVAVLARRCAALMRRRGHDVAVCQALRPRWRVRDQAGLSAAARASNLDGALRLRRGVVRDPVLLRPIVVVDDVVTTGSSAAEAVRVLRTAGLDPVALATVAATRRRRPEASATRPAPAFRDATDYR